MDEQRLAALDRAISISKIGDTADQVVNRAEKFYDFLNKGHEQVEA